MFIHLLFQLFLEISQLFEELLMILWIIHLSSCIYNIFLTNSSEFLTTSSYLKCTNKLSINCPFFFCNSLNIIIFFLRRICDYKVRENRQRLRKTEKWTTEKLIQTMQCYQNFYDSWSTIIYKTKLSEQLLKLVIRIESIQILFSKYFQEDDQPYFQILKSSRHLEI